MIFCVYILSLRFVIHKNGKVWDFALLITAELKLLLFFCGISHESMTHHHQSDNVSHSSVCSQKKREEKKKKMSMI